MKANSVWQTTLSLLSTFRTSENVRYSTCVDRDRDCNCVIAPDSPSTALGNIFLFACFRGAVPVRGTWKKRTEVEMRHDMCREKCPESEGSMWGKYDYLLSSSVKKSSSLRGTETHHRRQPWAAHQQGHRCCRRPVALPIRVRCSLLASVFRSLVTHGT
jgi:hypothetical protein